MKKTYQFPVLIEQDAEGWYIARVPDLRGCHTQARTLPELYTNIQEVIELCVQADQEKNIEEYEPKTFVGSQLMAVSI